MFESKPSIFGVIGNPVSHSRSPEVHKLFALEEGLHIEYRRIYATEDTFNAIVQSFFKKGGCGLNVTLPFKEKALKMADILSPRAQLVGAVNTLKLVDDQIYGDTTDGQGLMADIQRLGWTEGLKGNVVIIGAGGAVRSILPDLLLMNPQSLTVLNRTLTKAQSLIDDVESWRQQLGFTTVLLSDSLDSKKEPAKPDFIINGASQFNGSQLELNLSDTYCYDLNYGIRSQGFMSWAQSQNATKKADGFGMLVGQAAVSFHIWTDKMPQIGVVMPLLEKSNPWLEDWWQPPFHRVDLAHLNDAVVQRLHEKEEEFQERLHAIREGQIPLTWNSLVRCYEELNDRLSRVWSPLSHLNGVQSSDELRAIYNRLQLEISDHYTRELQNPLFKDLVNRLLLTREAADFTPAQKKWCENKLLDFRLAGAELDEQGRLQFAELERELAELSTQFTDKVLDATEAWHYDLPDYELEGVPKSTLEVAKEEYRSAHPESETHMCRLTLKAPCYLSIMRFCRNQEVRKQIYEAYVTRASDQGPFAGSFDTTDIIQEILLKRSQQSTLLGFKSYAEYSLATKMASSSEQVLSFLNKLGELSRPQAYQEYEALKQFAVKKLSMSSLEPWDYMYASEALKAAQFDLDQEKLQAYFPTDQVLEGLFQFISKLFGVVCTIDYAVPTYHTDVRFVALTRDGQPIGGLYIDLYARSKKRGGAWMDECRQRYVTKEGIVSLPIAYLVCNSSPPAGGMPSLMTHDEVVTLFHESGHCLHHLLSQVNVAGVAGIQGVEWDAVEVPSQLIESWCFREEVLPMLSRHYQTGLPLPKEELAKIIAAKNFQSALGMMKQLEYSLFDMALHCEKISNPHKVPDFMAVLEAVRNKVGILPVPAWHRFPHAFSHIFAGGYAAGYYGYKWAEVYAADLFSEFKRAGVFNLTLGQQLYDEWFSMGGVRPAEQNFQAFMGRDLNLNSLLEDVGINEAVSG